jgi:uncharacterized membrane protein YjfL (UPF0719 family)
MLAAVVICYILFTQNYNKITSCNSVNLIWNTPTCFGSRLPLSGSLLDPSELLEIHKILETT